MQSKIIKAVPTSVLDEPSLPKIIQTILSNRGVGSLSEIDLNIKSLLPISSLDNVDVAADLLAENIFNAKSILIVADFDADGATACAVAIKLLSQMGAIVDFKVPHRIKHGYGLSTAIVADIIKAPPDLIVTVDNGISSHEGILLAQKNGIKVLVTDHHLPAATLPSAEVIVNPNLPSDNFASKNLAGVGVIFYVMCGLHAKLKRENWYEKSGRIEPVLSSVLDLVALGTVADVVSLDKNNRILVNAGLQRIRQNKSCEGIKALFKIINKDCQYALASDFGFMVGPRINAAGRMQDMRIGINCLLADNATVATSLAIELDTINSERREVEQEMREEAEQIVKQISSSKQLPFGISLYDSKWHSGVVGIVAGRIKERHNRPVVVFALEDDNILKGSARSIKGLNIRDVLDNVAKNNPGMILKFGGHAMAAGLSVPEAKFALFKQSFDAEVAKTLSGKDLDVKIISDGSLVESDFSLELAEALQNLTPWGQNFAEPIFDNEFLVIEYRIVGNKHIKMVLQPVGTSLELDAIAFNTAADILPPKRDKVTMAYQLDVNRWQGRVSIQLRILEIEI